ncbi:type II toxin-antitoxin system VapC family toxin [Haloarcula onubensis]|uniref:Ribonuclease VapC n=1 Tax=Haloarcula onubensis TaxID=2950539 RepID=A0ABU2FIB1_9EURY|nr:type II toxin-antitoxin system VapC family toxin [Halomicroarcula sp. S3CR25-11]MDS0280500.1 type II toxin-antitoxin system VapC family toxin [Halomicroarcula sp. S3CR25-11]
MHCLDANVWIYYFDDSLDEHAAVREPVGKLLQNEPIFTTTVLQMEVGHYLTTQLADSSETVDRFLRLSNVTTAELSERDVATGANLLETHDQTGLGGRDATVLAAMKRHDVSRLWTHDKGLKRLDDRLDWLTVTDPVESGA